MNNPLVRLAKKKAADHYSTETPNVKGIVVDRDRPITAGWCGNDNCEHLSHNHRRAAQAGADSRANK